MLLTVTQRDDVHGHYVFAVDCTQDEDWDFAVWLHNNIPEDQFKWRTRVHRHGNRCVGEVEVYDKDKAALLRLMWG